LYDDLVSTVDAQKQSLIRAKVIRADAQAAQDAAGKKAPGGLATTLVSGGTLGVVGIANAVGTRPAGSKAARRPRR
jgi:hypothetical protein